MVQEGAAKRMRENANGDHCVKDMALAEQGRLNIELAERNMRALLTVRDRFAKERPLAGVRMGVLLHVTKETAVLLRTLKAGGAELAVGACNVMSTQDDVAAALVAEGMQVWAIKGCSRDDHYAYIRRIIDWGPTYVMDDGLDLTATLYQEAPEKVAALIGGSEQTSSGVIRAQAMQEQKALKHPLIPVNDNKTKSLLDNYYGTGQSSIDGILRATNTFLPGKTFVVCGYGVCGKGVAMRARGMGCNVAVTEVDPFSALQAVYDGMRVMPLAEAAPIGDIFLTATGNKGVLRLEHMRAMKDGAMICNAGQFQNEVQFDELVRASSAKRTVRPMMDEYTLDGKRLFTLGGCNLVNLSCAEGHPSEVMATSFLGQALAAEYIVKHRAELQPAVHALPLHLDSEIARLQLEALGFSIDRPTKEQSDWMHQWKEGL
eukprot:TRINITY_DN55884_c0_g1_i1.p2 TRINITY_DN55884_c0_g1~~TRINITY_DN55884_c0_g1_i1.p2  ORF type:complete len:432 (+),score=182.82 TRINITY_DN55884_c0_g1_i1:80-1375(+)